jgi:hypothetical protein
MSSSNATVLRQVHRAIKCQMDGKLDDLLYLRVPLELQRLKRMPFPAVSNNTLPFRA